MKTKEENHWKRGMKIGALVGAILFLIYYGFVILLGIGLESSLGDGEIKISNFLPTTIEGMLSTIFYLLGFILIPALIGATIGFLINKKN